MKYPNTMAASAIASALVLFVFTTSTLAAPGFKLLRFNEEWAATDAAKSAPVASLKAMELGNGRHLTLGGEFRARGEHWRNFAFDEPADSDDSFLLHRYSAFGDLSFGNGFRIFAEALYADATDRDLPGGKRPADVDGLDFKNLFFDYSMAPPVGESATLRVGRQQLAFGKQRLVSPLPWANSFRKWDGISLIVEGGPWKAHGFATQFVENEKYDLNSSSSEDRFHGLYLTRGSNLDLYYLYRDNEATAEELNTVGIRFSGLISGWDYDFETAYQFGDRGSEDISAWMLGTKAGYRVADVAWSPRPFIGFDFGSGDDDPNDGDANRFNQLFPLGHAYLGFSDLIGRQNILAVNSGMDLKPSARLTVTNMVHGFWRADKSDALYNAGGGVLRSPTDDAGRFVGIEYDLTASYNIGSGWRSLVGYSALFGGDFIKDTGSDKTVQVLYGQIQYRF